MSVTQVGPNKYRLFISDGFNLDGSRRRFSKTIETDLKGRDLEKFLTLVEFEFEDEVKKKDPKFEKLSRGTFEEYSVWWIDYKEIFDKIEKRTKKEYQKLLDTRILKFIGKKIITNITNGDLIELIKEIEKSPAKNKSGKLSSTSIKHYHTLLKSMFSDAMTFKIITDNHMDNVKYNVPKAKLKDNYYEYEDIEILLKLLPGEPVKYQLATLLAFSLGPRCGEITAIRWNDPNYNTLQIDLYESNSYVEGIGSYIKDPKNETSIRSLGFPHFLVPLFKEHEENELIKKEKLGDKWFYGDQKHEDDFVFTQNNGKAMFVSTPSRWFHKFLRKHNLKLITFHGLRHTNTTVLISEGIDIVDISKGLGHAKPSTTTDFYAHVLKSKERKKADVFDNIVNKSQQKTKSGTKSGTKKVNLRVVK